MHILSSHKPVIFMSTSPEGVFCHVVIFFWGRFLNFFFALSKPTHTDSSNKCKQAESLLSSRSHATFQSTEAPHQVCYNHNYVPCVFRRWRFSFAARRRTLDISSWRVLKALISETVDQAGPFWPLRPLRCTQTHDELAAGEAWD